MKGSLLRIFILFFVFLAVNALQAQQLPVNIDALTDEQLVQYLNQAQLAGLSEAELETKARERGISNEQIAKLKIRLQSLNIAQSNSNGKQNEGANADSRRKITTKNPSLRDSLSKKISVFGSELFDNENLTFEPNLNIPTPKNYILGVDDQILVDVYGYSEASFKLKVTTEGFVKVPGLGLIKVLGLSMEDAQKKIKQELTKIYSNISTGLTSVNISLGQIRSIRVTLIGEIKRPGTYMISSFSTIANALYASGGPNEIGSFRKIELMRNGKQIAVFDLYDFLLNGNLSKNLVLQDDDIIKVAAYDKRVTIKGAIKRPAIFEADKNETLSDIIRYAGGFADIAFKDMIRVKRFATSSKELISVKAPMYKSFNLVSGDSLIVDSLADIYSNRVKINGAVSYPGSFGLDNIKTLKDLLEQAKLKEIAYMDRAILRRFRPDYSPQIIDFSPSAVLKGEMNYNLVREDSIQIYNREDLLEKYTLQIEGEVNKPGKYQFSDSMKVQDLILMAEGYKDGASLSSIEVSRRNRTNGEIVDSTAYSVIYIINANASTKVLNDPNLAFVLQPFDLVNVRKRPNYKEQIRVTIEGEVLNPGIYSIKSKSEKLSDLVKRAGGLGTEAFPEGAVLIRNTFQGKTASDSAIFNTKLSILNSKSNALNKNDNADKTDLAEIANNKTVSNALFDFQRPVGIKLAEALKNGESIFNLLLEEGDVLKIPKKIQTVQSFGAVNFPQKIVYREGLTLKDVVNESGGFSDDASKKRAYIVYANGEVKSTKHFLFFSSYPKVKTGAEIYVPIKSIKKGLSTAEFIGIASVLASTAGIVVSLINTTK